MTLVLINVFTIVYELFIILQLVPPLCDYKVWIDTASASRPPVWVLVD
jgi:hypothetical protein